MPLTKLMQTRRRRVGLMQLAALLLGAQLFGAAPALAVCEELLPQMFSGTLNLHAASKACRKHIEDNVKAHAMAAVMVEVCKSKKNYSRNYKNRVYKAAMRCVEKKSTNWLLRRYNRSRAEQLKQLRAHPAGAAQPFCRQKNVIEYLRKVQPGLAKTLADAKSKCS